MDALIPDSPVGLKAEPSTSGGPTAIVALAPPTPASSTTALGIPVHLDEDGPADVFTADWVISSQSHVATLYPTSSASQGPERAHSVQAVVILSAPIPNDTGASEDDTSDSTLFVFPPRALHEALGTATAMQVGHSTFSCPDGYCA